MSPVQLALLAVLAPVVVALLGLFLPPLRRSGQPMAALSVLGALTSLGASIGLFLGLMNGGAPALAEVTWLPAAGASVATIGVLVDGISASMLVVVSLVATAVQVFSLSYMSDEPPADFGRYYVWHSLFLFSMQGLVIAPNILQLFACWELVGLCSYLLIGFYWQKPSAANAAVKAFWVTKFADMGLLLGLILQYVHTGTFGWDAATVDGLVASGAITAVAGMYFVAVMGKSAQFPLHIWLPDAMEGPTPVSALLHAATMVAAGVFLIVRAYPIFLAAESVMLFMTVIGGITAFMAGCIAVVQTDIKRVLAYSTCSQLGYMIAALGAGSLMAGYFHLTTHAFFKALLFLSAGSVIHAVHSNELKDMGGLWSKMKVTTTVFIVGSVALAGLPLVSGFYSKDLILETLFEATQHNPVYWIPFLACMATAGLTAYYMARVVFLTFFGPISEKSSHAHESDAFMLAPLGVLAVLSVVAGWGGGELAHLYGVHDYHFALLHVTPVGVAATTLALCGIGLAAALHLKGMGTGLVTALTPVGDFIRSAPIDSAWEAGYRKGLLGVASLAAWFDRYVIDGLVNVAGVWVLRAGESARDIQTGRVNDYLYVVVGAALILGLCSQVWLGMGS
jgi:NADH-quinone oxidoreductase subunit L